MTITAQKTILIENKGTVLETRTFGKKDNPVIFLLHGGPGVPDAMEEVVQILKSDFHVILFDQRGSGNSTCPDGDYSMEAYISDINKIADHLDLKHFHLFGHSWGGVYAQIYAQSFPERIESLFLCSPGSGTGKTWKQTEKEVLQYNKKVSSTGNWLKMGWNSFLGMMGSDHAHRRLFRQVMGNYHMGYDVQESKNNSIAKIASKPINKTRNAILRYPELKTMHTHRFPIQITYGENDIYGDSKKLVTARYPKAKLNIIPSSGHIAWKHNLNDFKKIIKEFYHGNSNCISSAALPVNDLLNEMINTQNTPGLQYQISKSGKTIFHIEKGFQSINQKVYIDKNTRFNLFSATKTFTALAILQLQEKGKLSLQDKLSKYLPEITSLSEITIKDLLNHQSGIKNPLPLKWVHTAEDDASFDYNKWIDQIISDHQNPKGLPGDKFAYSNIGYIILGKIIEIASGQSYESFIKQSIIQKIPAVDYLDFERPIEHYATGYHKKNFSAFLLKFLMDSDKYIQKENSDWLKFNPLYLNGKAYGGLISNAQSVTNYLQTLMRDNSPLFNDQSKKLLFEEQTTNNGILTGMALGWFTGSLNGHRYFCHAGGGGGYYCEIRIYPDLKISSVLILNRSGFKDERLLDQLDLPFID